MRVGLFFHHSFFFFCTSLWSIGRHVQLTGTETFLENRFPTLLFLWYFQEKQSLAPLTGLYEILSSQQQGINGRCHRKAALVSSWD